ncbi:MAG: hypothetical protein WBX30_13245 [Stellaceae bacterium]
MPQPAIAHRLLLPKLAAIVHGSPPAIPGFGFRNGVQGDLAHVWAR